MSVRWHYAALSLVTCAQLQACADAGDDTASQPEALLSVHATVLASAYPLSQSLIPALTFTPFMTNWGHSEFIVLGEHTGLVPYGFSLRVYDEPPAEALNTLTKGEPALAFGGITLVSPDHPARLDWKRTETGQLEVCSDDGECGQPSAHACVGTSDCLGTLVPGKNWGNHGVSGRYIVLYLAESARAGGVYSQFFAQGQALSAGYHVVSYEPIWESLAQSDRQANVECQDRATATALAEFNAEHGTEFANPAAISDGGQQRDTRMLADWDGMMIASTVSEGCVLPGSQHVVAEPDSAKPLDLVLVGL